MDVESMVGKYLTQSPGMYRPYHSPLFSNQDNPITCEAQTLRLAENEAVIKINQL
jgi:hypothetical protein